MATIPQQIKALYSQIKCLKEQIGECCSNFIVPTGLEVLDEGNGNFWRLVGRDPDFYLNGGANSIDFGENFVMGKGVSGGSALNIGEDNLITGYSGYTHGKLLQSLEDYARAYGEGSIASEYGAVADGTSNTSSGIFTWTRGISNLATKDGNVAWGDYNQSLGLNHTWSVGHTVINKSAGSLAHGLVLDVGNSWGVAVFGQANVPFVGAGDVDIFNANDPIMIVGNGTHTIPASAPWVALTTSNALFLDKGGRLFLPSVDNAKIDTATGDIVITKNWFLANVAAGGDNDFVTAGAFNTSTGNVTLTIPNQTNPVYNLDGRYLLISNVVPNTNDFLTQHLFSLGVLTSKVLNRPDVVVDMNGYWLTAADIVSAGNLQEVTDNGNQTDNPMIIQSALDNGLQIINTVSDFYGFYGPHIMQVGDGANSKFISIDRDQIKIQNTDGFYLSLISSFVSAVNKQQVFQDDSGTIALVETHDLQAVSEAGNITTLSLEALSFITTGGVATDFVKGDGTLDPTEYISLEDVELLYVPYTGAHTDVNIGTQSLSALSIITDFVDFNPTLIIDPPHKEGRIYYDKQRRSFTFFNDEEETALNGGEEVRIRVYNDNGVTLNNGYAVTVTGVIEEYPGIFVVKVGLAIASSKVSALNTIGIVTHDIEVGTYGWAATTGSVNNVNTSSLSPGSPLWLSDTVPGWYQETRPLSPSYEVRMGGVLNSGTLDGVLYAELRIISNDQDNNAFYNGGILEPNNVHIHSNGTTVNCELHSLAANGRLSLIFNQEYVSVADGINIDLILGTDTDPIENWVYIDPTGTMQVSIVGFPTGEQYTPIARAVVPSAATSQSQGLYKLHAYTDHLQDGVGQGHLTHLNSWIRRRFAQWENGIILGAITEDVAVASIDLLYTSGAIDQLHEHNFPVYETPTRPAFIINDFNTSYSLINGITSAIDTDSNGDAIGNNKYYNLVVWGVVSEEAKDCKLFFNLPSGSYTNITDATNDVNKTLNYTIPHEYKGVGFLLTRFVVKRGNTQVTIPSGGITDLRGTIPSVGGGSTIGGGGISLFDELTDTPITKIGNSLKGVRVDVGELTLEYYTTPVNKPLVALQFLDSFTESTGVFTSRQPIIADILNLQTTLNTYLLNTTDTLTGVLTVTGNVVSNPPPTINDHLTNKLYVDTTIAAQAHVNDFVVSHAFDISTGIFTSSVTNQLDVTVGLDDRYLLIADAYVHPPYLTRVISTSGAEVLSTFTSDALGSVTSITKRTITLLDLGYTGATDANNYVHPNHSGDATSLGDGAITFATVNVNVGSFTYANITVNAKGLITAASNGVDNNFYLTALAFNTGDGILTATVNGAANPTVDLDGRYGLIGGDLQNLQEVTDTGNSTTNTIVFSVGADEILVKADRLEFSRDRTTTYNQTRIQAQVGATNQLTLPSDTGTLALVSELDAYVTLNTDQTITSTKTIANGETLDFGSSSVRLSQEFNVFGARATSFIFNPSETGTFAINPTNEVDYFILNYNTKKLISNLAFEVSNTGSFTGLVTAATAPTLGGHLTNKTYVDSLFPGAGFVTLDTTQNITGAKSFSVGVSFSDGFISLGGGPPAITASLTSLGVFSGIGFVNLLSSDSYMLLGGGGTKLLTDFALATDLSNYLLNTTDTLTGNLTVTDYVIDPANAKLNRFNGRQSSWEFGTVATAQHGTTRYDLWTGTNADTYDPGDGHLQTFFWDNTGRYDSQFFVPVAKLGSLKWRAKENGATYGDWTVVLDSLNFDSEIGGKYLRSDVADIKTNGNLTFNNNVRIELGNSGDYSEIFSNGSDNYWKLKLGDLIIQDNSTERFRFGRTTGKFSAEGLVDSFGLEFHGVTNSSVRGSLYRRQNNGDTGSGNSYYTTLVNGGVPTNAGPFNEFIVDNQFVNLQTLTMNNSSGLVYGFADTSVDGETAITLTQFSVSNIGDLVATGNISSNGTYYYGDGKRIVQHSDTWLRFNPNGDFSNGIYISGSNPVFRIDTVLQTNSSTTTGLYANYTTDTFRWINQNILHTGNFDSEIGGNYLRSDVADNKTLGNLTINDGIAVVYGNSTAISLMFSNGSYTALQLNSGDFRIRDGGSTDRFTFGRTTGDFTAIGNIVSSGTGHNSFVGNVGIGTTSPNKSLHIYHATTDQPLLVESGDVGVGISLKDSTTSSDNSVILKAFADDMAFYTNGVERARIKSGGNFGIGTTSPASLLSVIKGSTSHQLQVGTADGQVTLGANNLGQFLLTGGRKADGTFATTHGTSVHGLNGDIQFGCNTSKTPGAAWGLSTRMIIKGVDGNVGIGTTDPDEKLDLRGRYTQRASVNEAGVWGIKDSGGSTRARVDLAVGGDASLLLRDGAGSYNSIIRTNGVTHFNGGNVGIGASSPLTLLEVYKNDAPSIITIKGGLNTQTTLGNEIGSLDFRSNDPSVLSTNDISGRIVSVAEHTNGAWTGMAFYTADNVSAPYIKERMRISNLGNVGIGTSSPDALLHISQGVNATSTKLKIENTDIAIDVNQVIGEIEWYSNDASSSAVGVSGYIKNISTDVGAPTSLEFGTRSSSESGGNASTKMTILPDGNVGVGITSPSEKLHVVGKGLFTDTVTATNFILSSDERLKTNILDASPQKLKVDWKVFNLKSDLGQNRYGVIAQELEVHHPEFVRTDEDGMKSVAYIDLLIAKNVELEDRVEKLEKLIDKLIG